MSTQENSNGTSAVEEANAANERAHAKNLTEEKVHQFYSEWARQGTYDTHLGPQFYRGPVICSEFIKRYIPNRNAEILDVAAGTGRLGTELRNLGYTRVDALEPAEGMLELAREKKVYRNYILQALNTKNPELFSDTYDAIAITGGMGQGHIRCDALPEMVRCVKKGGYIIIVMRQAYLQEVDDYRGRLEPKMAAMEAEGQWQIVERTVVPKYSFQNDGVVFVFKVLKNSGSPVGVS